MSSIIEYEKTYLAKYLPTDLQNAPHKDMVDIYLPASADHPKLRIRKNGEKLEITKKHPVTDGDASTQHEFTIPLEHKEYQALQKLPGKRIHKIRYQYPYKDKIAEFDVFQDELKGLVLVDIETSSEEEKANITTPDFCLAEVTNEGFIAGGLLCGKTYDDIKENLKRFDYQKLSL